jgi:hypothetical protein
MRKFNKPVRTVLLLVFAASIMTASCGRRNSGNEKYVASDTTGTAIIKFEEMEHDFGTIKAGEHVGHIFSFTNSGDADLVISSATASCGCTVTKYDRKPIPPQGNGTVEVNFDSSGRAGKQTKTVVVQSNAENKLVILRIIAEIQTKETN